MEDIPRRKRYFEGTLNYEIGPPTRRIYLKGGSIKDRSPGLLVYNTNGITRKMAKPTESEKFFRETTKLLIPNCQSDITEKKTEN